MEDSLPPLRDYVVAKHIWLTVVPLGQRENFFCLNLKDYILANLKPACCARSGVDWSSVFGIAIWRLWFWPNQALFSNVQISNHSIIVDIIYVQR